MHDGIIKNKPIGIIKFPGFLYIQKARELDDADRFIFDNPVVHPDGYEDIAAFNQALAAHVTAHPSLTVAPKAHATVAGQHSGELLGGELGPIKDFSDIVMAGFNTYRRRFIGEPAHPFLDVCPKDVRLSIWGVVMHASQRPRSKDVHPWDIHPGTGVRARQ